MTKTEAAEIFALDVHVWARKAGVEITPLLVQERMSEARHWGGLYPSALAAGPSYRTVLAKARAMARESRGTYYGISL